jgi:tRNA-splicing ligase RtcB
MELKGKYGTATVFTDTIGEGEIAQITNLLNQPFVEGSNVRIMPDCHVGAGCVIGFTAKLTDKVVPNLIGVDIGCGVAAWNLGLRGSVGEKFDRLDRVIRKHVPFGRNVREAPVDDHVLRHLFSTLGAEISYEMFLSEFERICKSLASDHSRVMASIGSLGGGNHFIEVDHSREDELWLVIHSGSRNFGMAVAKHHQAVAEESLLLIDRDEFLSRIEVIRKTKKGKGIEVAIKKLKKEASRKGKATGLEYLEGAEMEAYFRDMKIAQILAQLSRRVMAYEILKHHYGMDFFAPVESVHNYIDFEDNIMRKGAIPARAGQELVIPLNMADGLIYGIGKGAADWNCSAPHGAGRKFSRSQANQTIPLEAFQKLMQKAQVWTTCVGKATLDEAPQAYKKADEIISKLPETVEIVDHLKPVYNFKASE